MNRSKKVLFVNLNSKTFEIKTLPELDMYVGGFSLGIKILQNFISQDPLIFAIGPLNGFFPFASKTAIITKEDKVEDVYIGGSLGSRMRYSDLDAIVFLGKSSKKIKINIEGYDVTFFDDEVFLGDMGLPGKRCVLEMMNEEIYLDNYFKSPNKVLYDKMKKKNLSGFVLNTSKNFNLKNIEEYNERLSSVLSQTNKISVSSGFFPSCNLCPMGCEKSAQGEYRGDIILHSLVCCEFSKDIFSNINTVFSCLNSVGSIYTHEDLERLPSLVNKVLKKL